MTSLFLKKIADFTKECIKDFKPVNIQIENLSITNNKDCHPTNINIENKTLELNLTDFDKNNQKKLGEIIDNSLNKNKDIFLSLNQSRDELIGLNESISPKKEEIEFFRDKIPERDFIILKSAVYIQSLYPKHKSDEANRIKQETVDKYGEIARNIINLYTSGYYISQIKPLYEILLENGMEDQFDEMYKIIVVESRYVMFVNTNQSLEEIIFLLKDKINSNRTYHIDRINVHGINHVNVKKIEDAISSLGEEFASQPLIIRNGETIIAKLKIKIDEENQKNQTRIKDLSEICSP